MFIVSVLALAAAASQSAATKFTCQMTRDTDSPQAQAAGTASLELPKQWTVSFEVPIAAANAEDLAHGIQAHVHDQFLGIKSSDGLIGGPPAFSFGIDEHTATKFKGGRYNLSPWEHARNDMLLVEYKTLTVGKADARVGYGRGPCRATPVSEKAQ
jgi:hypothetical protein